MNQKELFYISLTIFFTVVAWVLLEIYRVKAITNQGLTTKYVVVENIKIDSQVLEILKQRNP